MHPLLERLKPFAGVVAVIAAAGTWALAYRAGSSDKEWNDSQTLGSSIQTRGKEVAIHNDNVETTREREQRLAKRFTTLRGIKGDLKKELMGDGHDTRGDQVQGTTRDEQIPDSYKVPPREACMQLKLEFPDKYGNLDCMAEKYDSPDPWWATPQVHEPPGQQ